MLFRSLAEVGCLVPIDFCEYRKLLSEAEQRAYDYICSAVSRLNGETTFPCLQRLDINKIVHAIDLDQPMFFYLDQSTPFAFMRTVVSYTVSIKYSMEKHDIKLYIDKLDRRLESLKLIDEGNLLTRELWVHNLMQRMRLKKGTSDWKDHCIVGPLLEHHTVCEGAAYLFQLLCIMCGVHCLSVSGTGKNQLGSGGHSWNIVKLNQIYAHVDAYWDCLLNTNKEMIYTYDYFNLNDQHIRRDHEWVDERYPVCASEKYSYFALCHAEVTGPDTVEPICERKTQPPWQRTSIQAEHITVRLSEGMDTTQILKQLENIMKKRLYGKMANGRWSAYKIRKNESQKILELTEAVE